MYIYICSQITAASDWPRLFLHPRCFCLVYNYVARFSKIRHLYTQWQLKHSFQLIINKLTTHHGQCTIAKVHAWICFSCDFSEPGLPAVHWHVPGCPLNDKGWVIQAATLLHIIIELLTIQAVHLATFCDTLNAMGLKVNCCTHL